MTSKIIYYCVYRITNLVEGKHYYGYKSSSDHPKEILGKSYFSSKRGIIGKEFIRDQKEHPSHYKYKVVQLFRNKDEALAREIKLHAKFNVQKNPKFYNSKNQTAGGFDTTGLCCVIDEIGNQFMVSTVDPDYISGKYTTKSKLVADPGVMTYKDITTGEYLRLHKSIAELNPERYQHIAKGQVTVRDSSGNTFNVEKTDPRYLQGELKSAIAGQVTVYDEKTGLTFNIYKDDPRYISGELKHINKIFTTVKDKDGNKCRVRRDDPRFLQGELVGVGSGSKFQDEHKQKLKGFVQVTDDTGTILRVKNDDPRFLQGELKQIHTGYIVLINKAGVIERMRTDDPRYLSGEFFHRRKKKELNSLGPF